MKYLDKTGTALAPTPHLSFDRGLRSFQGGDRYASPSNFSHKKS